MTSSVDARRPTSERELVACLSFAALTGAIVAGLGSPIVYQVSVTRGISIPDAQWTLIVTLLVGVVGTPILSRLADGRLRRGLLVGALLVVALGSVIALVPHFGALLVARSLQGFGYAMVPLTVSIARDQLSGTVLARTLGVLSTSVAVGVGLGNPAIGLCVLLGDYRTPFVLSMVVASTAAWWVWRRVPASDGPAGEVSVDVPGAILLAGGLGASLLALARGNVWGWTSTPVLVLAPVGVVLLVVWVLVELRRTAPLVDLRLATARGVLGVNVSALLLGIGVFGGVTIVILVVQRPADGIGLGHSVFVTGLLMLPMALASLCCPPLARRLAGRIGFRTVLATGSVLVASSFGFFARWHDNVAQIAAMMLLMGMGIGIAYSVMPALIVARTPQARTASATGVNQVVRLMGGAVGAAISAAVLAGHTPAGLDQPLERGYVDAALVAAGGALMAALVAWVLTPARDVDVDLDVVSASHMTAE